MVFPGPVNPLVIGSSPTPGSHRDIVPATDDAIRDGAQQTTRTEEGQLGEALNTVNADTFDRQGHAR